MFFIDLWTQSCRFLGNVQQSAPPGPLWCTRPGQRNLSCFQQGGWCNSLQLSLPVAKYNMRLQDVLYSQQRHVLYMLQYIHCPICNMQLYINIYLHILQPRQYVVMGNMWKSSGVPRQRRIKSLYLLPFCCSDSQNSLCSLLKNMMLSGNN